MEVIIKLVMVSINWQDGNFYVAVKDKQIPSKSLTELKNSFNVSPLQPVEIGLNIAEEIVSLSKQWMNCKIVNSYLVEDNLHIIYKTVIPYDPTISLQNGYEWINIKLLDTDETELINSVEESVRGIT